MGAAVVTRSPFDDHCRPLSMQSSQSKSAAAMVKPFTVWVVDDAPDLRHIGEQLPARSRLRGVRSGRRSPVDSPTGVSATGPVGARPDDAGGRWSGLTPLRRLRDQDDDLPVVMLTAKGEAVDRIIGPEKGADGYPAKPFLPRGLTSPASRPRTAQEGSPPSWEPPCRGGEDGLLRRERSRFPRERLIELARGPESDTDSCSVDVQVSRARRLIEPDPDRLRLRLRVRFRWSAPLHLKRDGCPGDGFWWGT